MGEAKRRIQLDENERDAWARDVVDDVVALFVASRSAMKEMADVSGDLGDPWTPEQRMLMWNVFFDACVKLAAAGGGSVGATDEDEDEDEPEETTEDEVPGDPAPFSLVTPKVKL